VTRAANASEDLRDQLKEYDITASMSRRGNCWDTACSETLFGSLKVERLHRQRLITRRHAKLEAWLAKYRDEGVVSDLDNIRVLVISPFNAMGTPIHRMRYRPCCHTKVTRLPQMSMVSSQRWHGRCASCRLVRT